MSAPRTVNASPPSETTDKLVDALLAGLGVEESFKGYTIHLNSNHVEHVDFEKLDKHIEALKAALAATQKNILSRIVAAQQIRNNLSVIHRLPTELLIRIFTWLLSMNTPRDHYKQIGKITQVSRSWNNLIQSTPSFWTVISSFHQEGLVRKALFKSKPYSLTVNALVRPHTNSFLPVFAQVGRWRSAELLVRNEVDYQTRLSAPAPLLEHLTLRRTTLYLNNPLNLFSGNAPRLAEVSLQGIPIQWESPMLSGLLSLEIKDIEGLGPTICQLLHVLCASPFLRTLILERIKFPTHQQQNLPVAVLEHLHCLTVVLPPANTDTILDHIRAYRCKTLRLEGTQGSLDDSDCINSSSLNQFTPLLISSVNSAKQITIYLAFQTTSCHLPNLVLNVKVGPSRPYELLSWLADVMAREPISCPVHLLLGQEARLSELPALYECLDKLWCVTALDVSSESNGRQIIDYLSKPRTINKSLNWPLPDLNKLSIATEVVEPDMVLNLVNSRYGSDAGPEDPEPVYFAKIRLFGENCDDDVYLKLVELVGQGYIHWDRPISSEEADEDDDDDYEDGILYSAGYDDDYL